MEGFIAFMIVFWSIAAVVVGSNAHAKGRSGVFWFLLVAVGGIFGVMYYALSVSTND